MTAASVTLSKRDASTGVSPGVTVGLSVGTPAPGLPGAGRTNRAGAVQAQQNPGAGIDPWLAASAPLPISTGRTPRAAARRVLPGFGLSMGLTVLYLSLIVLVPLSALFIKTFTLTWPEFWSAVASPRVMASYRLTFGASFLAAAFNLITGVLLAWVLVRYEFPGKKFIDALVDLPFALPTAVAGISLTALWAGNGLVGQFLETNWGIQVAFTPAGVVVALIFISMPFVVRTVQPVLEEAEAELEEAATCLGATPLQTFTKIILPTIMPALLTGFAMAFARAIGEYGSVIFIAGNMPMVSEITSLVIVGKLEQYDFAGATAVASVMLVTSFILLMVINLLQAWQRRRSGMKA